MSNALNKILAKAVTSVEDAKISRKSKGTKIASVQRVISIKIIKPFSL